eukprot:1488421-Rhodomonas_salina.1
MLLLYHATNFFGTDLRVLGYQEDHRPTPDLMLTLPALIRLKNDGGVSAYAPDRPRPVLTYAYALVRQETSVPRAGSEPPPIVLLTDFVYVTTPCPVLTYAGMLLPGHISQVGVHARGPGDCAAKSNAFHPRRRTVCTGNGFDCGE